MPANIVLLKLTIEVIVYEGVFNFSYLGLLFILETLNRYYLDFWQT